MIREKALWWFWIDHAIYVCRTKDFGPEPKGYFLVKLLGCETLCKQSYYQWIRLIMHQSMWVFPSQSWKRWEFERQSANVRNYSCPLEKDNAKCFYTDKIFVWKTFLIVNQKSSLIISVFLTFCISILPT